MTKHQGKNRLWTELFDEHLFGILFIIIIGDSSLCFLTSFDVVVVVVAVIIFSTPWSLSLSFLSATSSWSSLSLLRRLWYNFYGKHCLWRFLLWRIFVYGLHPRMLRLTFRNSIPKYMKIPSFRWQRFKDSVLNTNCWKLQYCNRTILQYYKTAILQYYNAACYNITFLQYYRYNTTTLQHYSITKIRILKWYDIIIPLLQYFILSIFQYCNFAILQW